MARLLAMPKLSDTMEEGAIASWLVNVGDKIREGDPLAEIETDKATMEYESPEEGFILKFVSASGDKARVGAPIAIIGDSKNDSFDEDKLLAGSPSQPDTGKSSTDAPEKTRTEKTTQSSSKSATSQTKSDVHGQHPDQVATTASRVKASPLAKKIAKEKGIALDAISGSGPHGRVVAKDLDGDQSSSRPLAPALGPRKDQSVRVNMMRQTIAKRLLAAKNEAPHFYLSRSIDMDRCLQWRQRLNEKVTEQDQPKVSVNDIVILACSRALLLHPMVNASWQGEEIVQYGAAHVALAVALNDGLVTPVIRNADQLGLREIARQSKDLALRAKDGKLSNQDYQGGTFTISNLGMMGIDEFTAIINPPQAAILAVGATQKQPVVDEQGQVVVRSMIKVTMSCDHRVIDGMVGARFLQTLADFLHDPSMMLA